MSFRPERPDLFFRAEFGASGRAVEESWQPHRVLALFPFFEFRFSTFAFQTPAS
jgi:hypothetical protein